MNISQKRWEGTFITLVPMIFEHWEKLHRIAQENKIWTHLPNNLEKAESMQKFVQEALSQKQKKIEFPFVILERKTNKVVGTTRFLNISEKNRSLEIGWTWFSPSVWGTNCNKETKYLLLKYCFETLNIGRVQFKTDERNIRSQKAIEKIGGVKEGILRNHMIRKDGSYRNSVFYSIIDKEWPAVKEKLASSLYSSCKPFFT
ncbi:GNAT family N-acetyltransferase [Priestia endophytica]|uniref:GNAT family N-acetyltransferase n=1 Tax=Priestia endophytica TaxID=135735 RepID=UPI002281C398|nr:GNAT family protein [Priestia endophytica]MCY8234577.1 GNAT family N-acetyltransferase [Priestia endophytica]